MHGNNAKVLGIRPFPLIKYEHMCLSLLLNLTYGIFNECAFGECFLHKLTWPKYTDLSRQNEQLLESTYSLWPTRQMPIMLLLTLYQNDVKRN